MANEPIIFDFGHTALFKTLCDKQKALPGKYEIHTYPDEETLIKILTPVHHKKVILLTSLDRPNPKLIPLLFAADTLRTLGATQVGLIAPYLAYMRQDKQFHLDEGITAHYFSKLLSSHFDWLTTIDPHLHRIKNLNEIFSIPTITLHAAPVIAQWINERIKQPILIGPDEESEQWVQAIAKSCQAPYLTVKKTRLDDTTISSTIPNMAAYTKHTPVLIDDIISTAKTMIETISHIRANLVSPIHCIGVHAIFAGDAYQALRNIPNVHVATCNTIIHPSNQLDISDLIAKSRC
jgi:ribose-phosphate pyrophosphokinase